MTEEARKNYHHELDSIRAEVLVLAQKVTGMIPQGTDVLLLGDLTAADELIRVNDEVESAAVALEERCYELLALQAPVAGDLRVIVASIEDRRRARSIRRPRSSTSPRPHAACTACTSIRSSPRSSTNMSRQAHQLFRFATDAFADADAPLAAALDDIDDNLDRLQVDLIQAIFEGHADGPRRPAGRGAACACLSLLRAHRRPCRQHRRAGALHGDGLDARARRRNAASSGRVCRRFLALNAGRPGSVVWFCHAQAVDRPRCCRRPRRRRAGRRVLRVLQRGLAASVDLEQRYDRRGQRRVHGPGHDRRSRDARHARRQLDRR